VGRDDVRLYRVDRIDGSVSLGRAGAYEVPADDADAAQMLAEGWQLGIDPPVRCRLRVDASHAPLALEHLDDAEVVSTGGDGSVVLELVVSNREAFRGMVLTYLDHAEILEPEELRVDLVEWLRQVPGMAS
jgi:proteasome accessory factor B